MQVWGMTLVAFLIDLPMLKSEVAFNAVASRVWRFEYE